MPQRQLELERENESEMARFSIDREEDDNEAQQNNPSSKRRRSDDAAAGAPSASSSSRPPRKLIYGDETEEEEQQQDTEDDDDEEEEVDVEAVVTPSVSGVGPTTRNSVGGSISVTLTDPDVLDCPICYDSLTIPVFQCDNGHTACSSCCKKVSNKCPSCSLPIGYSRCRAIEKVLESVKILCPNMQYGCGEMVSYTKKHVHDCKFAPCSCPVLRCSYVGSCKRLFQHCADEHSGVLINFQYEFSFPVLFTVSDKFLVLQEEKKDLFMLNNCTESLGHKITVSRIGPSSEKGYSYSVTARKDECTLRFDSVTKSIQKKVDSPPSLGFLLVPSEFFGSFGQITLELCIKRSYSLRAL